MEHYLKIDSLSHSFGQREIFADASLECRSGEILGLLGRNGTGKSTLFSILFGTLKPDQIKISLNGNDIQLAQLRQQMGYHTQSIMLPMHVKVRDLIMMFIRDADRQDKIFYARGINSLEHKKIAALSLGQQRYLQFQLILNLDHPFMLLDEPFSMVDPLYSDLIREQIVEYRSSRGFIITDHYYLDVLGVSDRLALIDDRKIKRVSSKEELISMGYLSEQYEL